MNRIADWDEEELLELGYTLRMMIRMNLSLRQIYENKLTNLRYVANVKKTTK